MGRFTLQEKLIRVSRNCGFTSELNKILGEKLTDYEITVVERWLQIVEQETRQAIENSKNGFRRY